MTHAIAPLMIGISGPTLSPEDAERLRHPAVGGVILFTRNFVDADQIAALTTALRAQKSPLLIAVDHEGGRVQRFRQGGFTVLPPMAQLGQLYDQDPTAAQVMAREIAWLMASELRAVGLDFSFAPVFDVDYGRSEVIGNRAFHRDPAVIADLAAAWIHGMTDAGMAAVAKHFPGHGYVAADSHHDLPIDNRSVAELARDLLPYQRLVSQYAAVMPAHVCYPHIDDQPAGFSRYWLQTVLRGEIGFDGVIISDDLEMKGAYAAGAPADRARAALAAGCELLLSCNDPDCADAIADALVDTPPNDRLARLAASSPAPALAALQHSARWQAVRERIDGL